jgi:hypothetical protein
MIGPLLSRAICGISVNSFDARHGGPRRPAPLARLSPSTALFRATRVGPAAERRPARQVRPRDLIVTLERGPRVVAP